MYYKQFYLLATDPDPLSSWRVRLIYLSLLNVFLISSYCNSSYIMN